MPPMSVLFFDLDNTLYPRSLGVVARIDRRINEYLEQRVGIPASDVDALRRRFWAEHGTTLRGLTLVHAVDPDDYLAYVHDIELEDLVRPAPALRVLLERIPARKVVFSNASRAHARRVIDRLRLHDSFEAVIGLEDLGYVPKPQAEAFRAALDRVGAGAQGSTLIDDLQPNLATAKRLGLRTVWVSGEESPAAAAFDHVVPDILDIEPIFCAAG
jgi:putative hydrolase of the HAD superfamily